MELRRGDLIEVQWVDIYEDPVGNPDKAQLIRRHSVGYFWSGDETTFITTMTMDEDALGQNGYCIYPLGTVAQVRIIRRGKGKAYRGRVPFVYTEPAIPGVNCSKPDRPSEPRQHGGASAVGGDPASQSTDVRQVPEGGSHA